MSRSGVRRSRPDGKMKRPFARALGALTSAQRGTEKRLAARKRRQRDATVVEREVADSEWW